MATGQIRLSNLECLQEFNHLEQKPRNFDAVGKKIAKIEDKRTHHIDTN